MDQNIAQLYDEGKVEQAIHLLIKKIDQHPQQVANYLQLSTYLIEQGSLDQAQKLLEQAQHLVKEPQELNYNLAVCYYMQGDFDKALALLDQIPNDDLTLYQKALTYLKLGQGQKALAYALDKKSCFDIYSFLNEYIKTSNTTIINITHNLTDIEYLEGAYYLIENKNILSNMTKEKVVNAYIKG